MANEIRCHCVSVARCRFSSTVPASAAGQRVAWAQSPALVSVSTNGETGLLETCLRGTTRKGLDEAHNQGQMFFGQYHCCSLEVPTKIRAEGLAGFSCLDRSTMQFVGPLKHRERRKCHQQMRICSSPPKPRAVWVWLQEWGTGPRGRAGPGVRQGLQ